MEYSEVAPSPHLTEFIKCFWSIQDTSGSSRAPEPVVPDGCLEIVFNLADRFQRIHCADDIETQPVTIVAGQMRQSVLIRPTGQISLFGIRFQHAGAFPFFQFSLSELTDRIEDIDSIWGLDGREIEERICQAATFEERVAIIETIFTARLKSNKKFDISIIEAARLIVGKDGALPIRQVAELIGVSERRLEREFKQKIGVSPKMFSRIIRFQKLLKSLESGGSEGLLDKALEFGYYDQAHMVHEFKEFAGKSPTTFIEDTHRISEAFTGN